MFNRIKGRDDHILLLFVRSSLCPFCLSLGFLSLPYLSFMSVTWLPVTSLSVLLVYHLASCHFPVCPSRLSLGFLSLPYLPFLLVCHLASCHFPVCRFFLSATWLPHLPFSTLLPSLLRDNPRKVIGAFRPSPTAWSLAPCSRASWKICLEHM